MSNKFDTFDHQNQQIHVFKSMHHTLRVIPSACSLTITLASIHLETVFSDVILRSKATKNLMVKWLKRSAGILRFAQNDTGKFQDRR